MATKDRPLGWFWCVRCEFTTNVHADAIDHDQNGHAANDPWDVEFKNVPGIDPNE